MQDRLRHLKWRANGHISTNGTKSFRYGYAAARIRFQPRRGQHGAFWMQPQTKLATEGSARRTGAEIDVIEWFGGNHPQGGLASFAHDYPKDGKPGVTPRKTGGFIKNPGRFGSGWAKKFHVFSVEWTPTRYIYRIDGRETFRTGKGVSGRPEFLILSLQSSPLRAAVPRWRAPSPAAHVRRLGAVLEALSVSSCTTDHYPGEDE